MSALDLPGGGRRYLQVAQQLADQINAGDYATGERLPPERDLATQLGVSRTTVREALLALEIMRFIEIRVGSGVYVLSEHLRDRNRGDLIATDAVGPWEVLEARRVVEGHSAYAAAQRSTEAQLDAIEATVDRMAAAIDDIPVFDQADVEFHALIAQAAGNGVIESYVGHLWRMRESNLWSRWYDLTRKPSNRRRSVQDHRDILRAMRRRMPENAKTAMQAHIDVLGDRFFELRLEPTDRKD